MDRKSWIACIFSALFAAGAAGEPGSHNNLILEGILPEASMLHVSIDGGSKESVEYSLPLVAGKLLTGLRSPVSKSRSIRLWAEDIRGERLYEGEARLEGDSGFGDPAVLELRSALDGATTEVTLSSRRVAIEFAQVQRGEVPFTRVTADVFDADGRRLDGRDTDLAWAIEDSWLRELMMNCQDVDGTSLCAEVDSRLLGKGEARFVACAGGRICRPEWVPAPTPVWAKISVGMGDHACALKKDGTAWCWGRNKHGELGAVSTETCFDRQANNGALARCSGMPLQVQFRCPRGLCRFIDISAGKEHTCAIDTNYDAWCWGGNGSGEIGTGEVNQLPDPDGRPILVGSPVPRMVSGGLKFQAIRAGIHSTCGLTIRTPGWSPEVYCWGSNNFGLVPDSARFLNPTPTRVVVPADVVTLDLRDQHACVRTQQGELFCWGSNARSQLVSGTSFPFSPSLTCRNCPAQPIRMQDSVLSLAGRSVALFSTGTDGTCASTTSGQTSCWGTPLPLPHTGTAVDRLSRGAHHYCIIGRGTAFCAGTGALGDGIGSSMNAGPVRVLDPPDHFLEIDAGGSFTCGIGDDQQIHCWGDNAFGKLGRGIAAVDTDRPAPVFMLQSLVIPGVSRM